MPQYVIFDIEADGLLWEATKVHCLVARYEDDTVKECIGHAQIVDFMEQAIAEGTILVGHNILGYDLPVLSRVVGVDTSLAKVVDTLVLSRMLNYKRPSGHSLASYGESFGIKKEGQDIEVWDELTPLMLERCRSDTAINLKIFNKFKRFVEDEAWQEAIEIEHFVAKTCVKMEQTGIPFDVEGALALRNDIVALLAPIDEIIARDFRPKAVPIKTVVPRLTKAGTLDRKDFRWWGSDDLSAFTGGPFTRFEYQEFNPASPQQVIDRLNEAGWKPTEKTDGHIQALRDRKPDKERLERFKKYGWKISEENLRTLPEDAPEATRSLAKRIVIQSRLSDLDEWLALVKEDGRIHPKFSGIGAWTHRLSHSDPNSANIPAYKPSENDTEFDKMIQEINKRMRQLWYAPKGWRLIGTDADGIQMRIFAHVVQDQKLIDALVKGKKEDGTDIHSVHQRALGNPPCGSRDEAKTFIYAFLLGAGVGRVSEIFACIMQEAKKAISDFIDFYPGLKQLKSTLIPKWAERGYFVGLDGRKVVCDSAHLMLAGILQNGEKVIMARAMREWMARLDEEKIPYQLVNWVHDEWQTLVPDDDDVCARVQTIQIESIRNQGAALDMLCPLEGSSSMGYNWMETH